MRIIMRIIRVFIKHLKLCHARNECFINTNSLRFHNNSAHKYYVIIIFIIYVCNIYNIIYYYYYYYFFHFDDVETNTQGD